MNVRPHGRPVALLTASAALLVACVSDEGATPAAGAAVPPAILCPIQQGNGTLSAGSRRGLIQHLVRYPVLHLATTAERASARRLLERIEAAADAGRWRIPSVATRKGFLRTTAPRVPGDRSVRYLHAELLHQRHGGQLLDPARPKALIYANAPGRPLVLVGAMYSLKRGERGPTPGGPITRWHSHLVCARGDLRGRKPPERGTCPQGTRLRQGSEMMHVWFTGDLRSAFAVTAPEPELCRAGLLPKGYCRALDGRRRGM
jgi:hypothetical protein